MKTKLLFISTICLILIISCNKKSGYQSDLMVMAPQEFSSPPPPPPPPSVSLKEEYAPKLIKKGDLTISSSDIESTKKQIYLLRCLHKFYYI